jgi:endonuclease/exonuclease/phosphatase family metal-dependent hydrolase
MRAFLFVLLMTLSGTAAVAEPLKIMSWNIANLAAEDGARLRGSSHIRTAEGYEFISKIIADADADIIALQEIGSLKAAQRVLGSDYEVALEERCGDNCEVDQGDIFTAIAYRKELTSELSNLSVVQMSALAIPHQSECANHPARKVRGGVGINFDYDGAPYQVLSVHLKATCADEDAHNAVRRPDVQDDCRTLAAQIGILANHIHQQTLRGVTVIAAGDYNRKFLKRGDRYASFLKAVDPALRFEPAEEPMELASCWPSDYPESASFRIGKNFDTYGEVDIGDGIEAFWLPYMPSSIGSRDFFVLSGPQAARFGEAREILLRPKDLLHDPTADDVSVAQREAITDQAKAVGVRFGPPNGYISTCDDPVPGELAVPKPFLGGNTVLSFQNTYPSDHCPIVIELD